MKHCLFLFGSGTCSAAASIFLKIAANRAGTGTSFFTSTSLLLHGVAVFFYAIGFVLYALSLHKLPLQAAYPAMVGAAILQIFIYQRLSGHSLSHGGITGAILIISGIYLVLRSG